MASNDRLVQSACLFYDNDINLAMSRSCFMSAHLFYLVCGGKLYDTEIDICCDGYIIHGGALGRWGCCGPRPYSLTRELCCNRTVHDVYNVETSNKHCCGSDVLDITEGICCNNQTFIGHSWCPGSFYGNTCSFHSNSKEKTKEVQLICGSKIRYIPCTLRRMLTWCRGPLYSSDSNNQKFSRVSHITRKRVFGYFRPGKIQTRLLIYRS